MIVTELGIVTDFNPVYWNAQLPITVTEHGIDIEVSS